VVLRHMSIVRRAVKAPRNVCSYSCLCAKLRFAVLDVPVSYLDLTILTEAVLGFTHSADTSGEREKERSGWA
jgi:hypothetical protein